VLLSDTLTKGTYVDDTDVRVQMDRALALFAQSDYASTLTPEELHAIRSDLHALVEFSLWEGEILKPCNDSDPGFVFVDLDGKKRKLTIRWDGVWYGKIRIADPFALNRYLRSNIAESWQRGDLRVMLVPLGDNETTTVRITGESSEESFDSIYLQFSRTELLEKLNEILPTIGHLVLTGIEPDEFGLEIQYYHRGMRGATEGGLIRQGQDVVKAVALMHGEVLALEMRSDIAYHRT